MKQALKKGSKTGLKLGVWSTVAISVLWLTSCILSACDQNDYPTSSTSTATSTPTSTATAVGTTTVGSGDSDVGFTLAPSFTTLSDNPLTYYFHEQSSLTSPCVVDAGTTVGSAASNLYCIIDVAEEDLHNSGLTLNVNVPPAMCPYTRVNLYSFYQYKPGNLTLNDVVDIDASGNCTMTPSADAQYWSGGACGGTPICPYNYSGNTPSGPNCCSGSATVITNVVGQTSAPSPVTTYFGGSASACVIGPAVDVYGRSASGYPFTEVYGTYEEGLSSAINIASPLSKLYSTNLYIGNYFDPYDFGDTSPANEEQPPSSISYYPSADPAPGNGTSPYYEFDCLDSAGDYNARIRMMIRSWDTVSNFTNDTNPYNYLDSQTSNYGTQATFNTPYHDHNDWYDLDPSNPDYFGSKYIGSDL